MLCNLMEQGNTMAAAHVEWRINKEQPCFSDMEQMEASWSTPASTGTVVVTNTPRNKIDSITNMATISHDIMFCVGGGFLSVKDAFSETGYPAFYR